MLAACVAAAAAAPGARALPTMGCGDVGALGGRGVKQWSSLVTIRLNQTTAAGRAAACCAACSAAPRCETWEQDMNGDECWLKTASGDSREWRSNFRGMCAGKVATRIASHRTLQMVSVSGAQDARDAACCAACRKNSDCEAWGVRIDNDDCYLWQLSYPHSGHSAGIAPGGGHWAQGKCSAVPQVQGHGDNIRDGHMKLLSVSVDDMDNECCSYCAANAECEFWVWDTQSNNCWLRKNWKRDFQWSTYRRTGFKTGIIDKLACPALQLVWRLMGGVLKLMRPMDIGSIKGLSVRLPTHIECDKMTWQDNHMIGAISNAVIEANMNINGLLGIQGETSLYIRANPNVNLDFDKCKAQ
eukprot:gene6777-11688_t